MAEEKNNKNIWFSRRDFLSLAGWIGFFSTIGGSLLATIRFLYPKVLYEPSLVFKIGYPSDYKEGVHYYAPRRLFVIREGDNFHTLYAKCTHLGCTVKWNRPEGIFECPCHGSKFKPDGVNYTGPAPRPLFNFPITLGADGQLIVDARKEVGREYRLKLG